MEEPIGKAFAGANSRYENAHVVMSRFGEPEDTWWTFSFSPLFEEDGTVGGAFCVTKEVTRMVVAQERLARENERLIALFDKSPMFMAFLHGPQHRMELLNAGYSDLIGNREVLGQRIVDALPEVVDQGYLPLLDEVYRTGVPYIGRRVAYAPLGPDSVAAPDHLLDVVFQPVRDEVGQVTGVFVQGLDITPQEELQRHLVQAESRHRQILDSARDYAIIATDLHGRITLWNEGAHAMTGWSEPDMLGHGPERLFLANERDTMQRYLLGVVRDGGISGENWYQRRNGEAFWAQGAITVLHDEEGAAAGFVAVLRDRTTERQARKALESSERRLGALVSATAQRVYAMSANWQEMRLILRDGATAHLLAPDMDWRTAFVHAEDHGRLNLAIAHAIATRQPLVIEHRAPGPGDTPAWTQTRAVPLLDEQGNIIEWFGTATDVSQRRNAETQLRQLTATLEERVRERSEDLLLAEEKLRQSQKMEAVGQLTGGIAHDFNNMLTAVSMGLELLELRLRQGSTEGLERYLEMARSGTDRATALTQRLLAFSRRQTLAPSVVDPDVLIASLQDIIARSLGPSIALRTELHGDGAHVQVDAPQLENAPLNLCIKARDAMPDGGRLLIRTRVETLDTERAQPGPAAWQLHGAVGGRHRHWHGPGHRAEGVRTVLHHQTDRAGHRAGAVDDLRLHPPVRRPCAGGIAPRHRYHDDAVPAALPRRGAGRGGRAGGHGRPRGGADRPARAGGGG
ncbi:MAG: Blue-light-activated protein [Stenotrophomonas maltophilia]|uniref:histidine kinase n=1 Tax=Stenotrophomonas maltophilia TaxID=40324 RepID=A0A7V8FJA1_STEMA|nr:MAG: Blue-light-activated protein [Stenotrophomonas maltophilia]